MENTELDTPAQNVLDIENKLDISKLESPEERLAAFQYLYDMLSSDTGIKISPQEMLYLCSTLTYIKDHSEPGAFVVDFEPQWNKVVECLMAGIAQVSRSRRRCLKGYGER